jgi:hypothetical protein
VEIFHESHWAIMVSMYRDFSHFWSTTQLLILREIYSMASTEDHFLPIGPGVCDNSRPQLVLHVKVLELSCSFPYKRFQTNIT